MMFVPSHIAQRRYTICRECEFFRPFLKQCSQCNCFMPAKVRLGNVGCPVHKWPHEGGTVSEEYSIDEGD